jgi:ADP-heptose:LPS heptosyltransferase
MTKRNVDIVLVRMDKIGDLVLSLPVDEHPVLCAQRVHWFISHGLSFVTDQAVPARAATEWKRRFTPGTFLRMLAWLRREQPRTIVLLHNPWWVSFAAWLAGVPERIGRRSQWHGFLFVNLPIRQKRSASDRHELDFNFDLVEWGFNRLGVLSSSDLAQRKQTYLRLKAESADTTLAARDLKPRAYRVVHPGMAGSALNWPSAYFRELIESLATDSTVVITGTKMDSKYLGSLKSLRENPHVKWLVEQLGTRELLGVLEGARSIVAPSTGVLHLAASLGTPALGIYSPRKVEHPRRWGPKGPHVKYLMPELAEGEPAAPSVMERITPAQVREALLELESADGDHAFQTQSRV